MRIVRDIATGRVVMWSDTGRPDAGEGEEVVTLSDEQAAAFQATTNECGVTFDGQAFAAIPPPPPPVPVMASSGDFVAALSDLGWYDAVDAAATAAGGRALALWRHAATFERHHPIVRAVAAAIGKTEKDLDTLFLKTREYQ